MPTLHHFFTRPRYLRAIPSLVVLTTAMAWGVVPEGDVQDVAQRKAALSGVQTTVQLAPLRGPVHRL